MRRGGRAAIGLVRIRIGMGMGEVEGWRWDGEVDGEGEGGGGGQEGLVGWNGFWFVVRIRVLELQAIGVPKMGLCYEVLGI